MPYFFNRVSFKLIECFLISNFISWLSISLFFYIFSTNTLFAQKQPLEPFFDETLALYGYKNDDGKVKIKPSFSDASAFNNGFAKITVDNKEGIINHKGKTIIPAIYDTIGWSGEKNKN